MSDIQTNETASPESRCLNCGSPDIIKNVPNALCADCRNAAVKFPIPAWVKIFGGAILVLVIFTLVNLPHSLTLGLNLERGIAAEAEHNFVTAQRYFGQVIRIDSANTEANEHLMIAAYYNSDISLFIQAANNIGDKSLEQDELFNRANALSAKSRYYFPSDSFYTIIQQYTSANDIPDSIYISYIRHNNDNIYEQTLFAGKLFDNKLYRECDSLCHVILNTDEENISTLCLLGSAKRFENQPDSAIYYCNQVLAMNREYHYASCLKARALLKLNKTSEALQIVTDCKNADSTEAYTWATLALVYHVNNQPQQRDAVLEHAEKTLGDSATAPIFQYVHDVINHKESL
jgi:tetratricopeptide (TPR) repeat protein